MTGTREIAAGIALVVVRKLVKHQSFSGQCPDGLGKAAVKRLRDMPSNTRLSDTNHFRLCQCLTGYNPDVKQICQRKQRLEGSVLAVLTADKIVLAEKVVCKDGIHSIFLQKGADEIVGFITLFYQLNYSVI